MAARRLPLFVEPFLSRRIDGRVRNDLGAEAVSRSIAIASGLGGTSAYTWLKLPVTDDPDETAEALETSTLPAVLLGGEVGKDQEGAYEKWRKALRLPTVQGMVVGRSLLYPPRAVWRPRSTPRSACCDTATTKGIMTTTHHLPAGRAAPATTPSTSPRIRRMGLLQPAGARTAAGGPALLRHRRQRVDRAPPVGLLHRGRR